MDAPPTSPAPIVLPTREGYDLWSDQYDVDGNPLLALEEPEVDRLAGDVRGLSVVDVGCGTGRHAVRFAERGAHVVGLDFSDGMLARAREKSGSEEIQFVAHDLSGPLPLRTGTFDRVLCCLVLEHVEALGPVFDELRRVCTPGGRVIVTEMHPLMRQQGVQARFRDQRTGQEFRPRSYCHEIGDYLERASAAGLRTVEVCERSPDEALAARLPRAKRYVGLSLLLAMSFAPQSSSRLLPREE